ncbi:hypothetical protein CASFOL_039374 [Castilleja foliolosa]|uniref:GDSL esterase/lipase n=1 Tax=Castilleja foliolosa TaxID=1961234 RepID=A0ABD3BHS9_9LAMI
MGTIITKWISLIILSILLKPQIYNQAQQVPCMFLYGDSQFDNGNNNVLITLAKTNYPPYGIDYPDGPTGRFSNGRTIPDFLAELLGFDNPISPFVTARGSNILRGVNYASGGAGILDQSGVLVNPNSALNPYFTVSGHKVGLRHEIRAKSEVAISALYEPSVEEFKSPELLVITIINLDHVLFDNGFPTARSFFWLAGFWKILSLKEMLSP